MKPLAKKLFVVLLLAPFLLGAEQVCTFSGQAGDIIHEMQKRKEALLQAALEYNAFASQFSQEAVAIDFKTGMHDPFCRIALTEPGMSLDTAADPGEGEHEAH